MNAKTTTSDKMPQPGSGTQVRWIEVSADDAGQRLDNFLMRCYRKVPKTLIYRVIRKGEVRVNKGRVKPHRKLQAGEVVRVPPIRQPDSPDAAVIAQAQLDRIERSIVYEDADLLVLNKPSGVAVHGGSGLSWGVVEVLRRLRPYAKRMELAHRLDRDTSGCLLVAKKASVLKALHAQIREDQLLKQYWALVAPHWPKSVSRVDLPLLKNTLQSGERLVKVSAEGKPSVSDFRCLETFEDADLVEVTLRTGRTHQIRVHAQASGAPVVGDEKYGDQAVNQKFRKQGMKRLALHARRLGFTHPVTGQWCELEAPLHDDFSALLVQMRGEH
ncbi:MAG: 23S rRNA pseudouridine(955/2504/2580) synthase RluC [Hydrogenovibrio sp.]|uniref:23S rRNA pseudouridine(955/2504/2580) synthase RluC n=1 Tax=Hydrogenovibrio sp. TaxID=2065821 RepID=UPI0028707C80|nr:23S rRNA pseudouridine(955/2504/2580) synthase RluC [Hydrogenovibrio sp.]MDR9498080.1 23S rRNA pseudouridine(955/2504/2580) synthase RluC [Hydrogenovibrio sp.]